MSSSHTLSWRQRLSRYPWWIWPVLCWSILVLIVAVRVYLSPTKGTVYPIFDKAGQAFVDGTPLYGDLHYLYRYAPVWAAFFSLGNGLPLAVSGTLWRVLSLLIFAWAAYRFQRYFFPQWSDVQRTLWWILMLPFCFGSYNNGQANILLLGLLLASIVTFAERRYWLCGWCLAVAINLKIYPIALALLLLLLQPLALLPALLIGLALLGVLPYAFQSVAYVNGEYKNWISSTTSDMRIDHDVSEGNRDGWQLARLILPSIDYRIYQALQAATALGLAVWTWLSRRQQAEPQANRLFLLKLYNLATIWMLVMGPSSESSTYALLAPLTALAMVLILTTPCSPSLKWLTILSFSLMFIAHLGATMTFTLKLHGWGIHPIGTLLMGFCVHRLLSTPPHPQTLSSLTTS